jgi:hypothetical protein
LALKMIAFRTMIFIAVIFSAYFLFFTALNFITLFLNNNLPQPEGTIKLIPTLAYVSGLLTLIFAPSFVFVVLFIYKGTAVGETVSNRINVEKAYNLKKILGGFTTIPIALLMGTFMIAAYTAGETGDAYLITSLILLAIFAVLISIQYGVLTARQEAKFLIKKFSLSIKNKSGINSETFFEGLKLIKKGIPKIFRISSMEKRILQVELILNFGDEEALNNLAKVTSELSDTISDVSLKNFKSAYRKLSDFLDNFEKELEGTVEIAEITSIKTKIKIFSGEVLREVIIKTSPVTIGVVISIAVYLALGIKV